MTKNAKKKKNKFGKSKIKNLLLISLKYPTGKLRGVLDEICEGKMAGSVFISGNHIGLQQLSFNRCFPSRASVSLRGSSFPRAQELRFLRTGQLIFSFSAPFIWYDRNKGPASD